MENAENLEDRLIRAARAVPPDKRETAIRCLEQVAAGEVATSAPEPSRPAAAVPIACGLEWPTAKWKGSAENMSRKRFQIVAFLRRVWKPFIEENHVIVTREILREKDSDAADALDGYLRARQFPKDIPILTSAELRTCLTSRPVAVVNRNFIILPM